MFSGIGTVSWIFRGYQYLKLRASRYPSHAYGAGPSRSQRHGRRWFPILIPLKRHGGNRSYCEI